MTNKQSARRCPKANLALWREISPKRKDNILLYFGILTRRYFMSKRKLIMLINGILFIALIAVFNYVSCGGGGASDIRIGGTALTNRVVVAGGGGGSSYSSGTGTTYTTSYQSGNGQIIITY
jgi:hypothetical protein